MRREIVGDAQLYLGDCMEYMATLSDKTFELAIVDPPYGIGVDGNHASTGRHGGRKAHAIKNWDDKPPPPKYFKQLFRVSKNQIIWGGNYFQLPPSMGWIVWDKGQRINQSDGELAYSSFDRALRILTMNRVELLLEGTIHPTQKPVALYKWLLSRYAKPGDKILDTHGGSGSSVVACIEMGFPIVWIEKDEDYYEAALDRIRRAYENRPRLFEAVDKNPVQNKLDL